MKKLSLTFALVIAAAAGIFANTAATDIEDRPVYEIHSMMIYNFVKYIQWPAENSQDFVIGVIGDDEVYSTLKAWYDGKVRGNKKFIIKKFNSASEITNTNILYVAKSASGQFSSIKAQASANTLLITDKPGLGKKGSGINFRTINNKLAFELNQTEIEKSNLKVSSQLSAMAIII